MLLAPHTDRALSLAAKNGDTAARDRLLTAYLPLIRSQVSRTMRVAQGCFSAPFGFERKDLIQTAVAEFIQRMPYYDPDRDAGYGTYIRPWLKGALATFVADAVGPTRVFTNIHDRRAFQTLCRMAHYNPKHYADTLPTATLAEMSRVSLKQAQRVMNVVFAQHRSLSDGPDETDPYYAAATTDDSLLDPIDDHVNLDRFMARVRPHINTLPERLQTVFALRSGLDGADVADFLAIGARFGVTKERARQLYAQAIEHLKAKLQAPAMPPTQQVYKPHVEFHPDLLVSLSKATPAQRPVLPVNDTLAAPPVTVFSGSAYDLILAAKNGGIIDATAQQAMVNLLCGSVARRGMLGVPARGNFVLIGDRALELGDTAMALLRRMIAEDGFVHSRYLKALLGGKANASLLGNHLFRLRQTLAEAGLVGVTIEGRVHLGYRLIDTHTPARHDVPVTVAPSVAPQVLPKVQFRRRVGNLALAKTGHTIRVGRVKTDLPAAQFELLTVLSRAHDRYLSVQDLAALLHKDDEPIGRQMVRLRQTLARTPLEGVRLRRLSGRGYCLQTQ